MSALARQKRRIQRHVENLASADDRISVNAERYLIRYYGARALDELVAACDSPNRVVRFRAVWALGYTHDPRAYETILRLTDDPDEGVRYDATLALGILGDLRALEPLTEYFWRQDESRPGADGLSRLGLVCVPVLVDALERGDPDLRWLAVRVLGWLADAHRDAQCLELLRSHLADTDPEVREEAEFWLTETDAA